MSTQPTDLDADPATDPGSGPAPAEADGDVADFEATVAELVPIVVPGLNTDFADSLLLVARHLGDQPGATEARITSLDPRGVDLESTVDGHVRAIRIDFPEPVTSVEALRVELLNLAVRAGEASGTAGQTDAERQAEGISRIRTFITSVHAVDDVHPHLRRFTFKGGDLATFEPNGPDSFLYLLLPPPGRTELGIDQSFSWEAHALKDPADQQVGAYYTLRAWRPEVAELDILMVLHGATGPASAWAERAAVGDPVALWGPRTAYHPPEGTRHLVLVADETGLPAVAVILEQLPEGWTAQVVGEVGEEAERQELPDRHGVEVVWLHRDGADPGTTTLLVDAVRALPPFPEHTYVWGGAESRTMTAVRRHVRDARGLAREDVSLVAYWRAPGSPADTDD